MPSTLSDRPVPATPQPPAPRRGTTALVVAAVLAGGLLVGADRVLDALPGFDAPFQEEVVDRSQPALLESLADLEEYHAAEGTFSVVVDLERDVSWLPSLVSGERTTYLAVGSVDGLVDLGALDEDAVEVDGTSVTITVPEPQLGEARLDLEQSRVLDRDRGLLDRVGGAFSDEPTSERDVALLAEDKLTAAAAESDLLDRTEAGTERMLTGLARSLGYDDVTVRFEGSADPT